ncbi:uncharacterized mitochondrial protein AtMg00310-like [Beta vulgaris subsp. vulgaris]|uniref:uncharacterized mitochondrial protein AtMg00310-like n=1 Tax=Beta vulgaris subsp. vulgaris TaxID=3555 RepID=UPI000901FBE6|nr:uncharacterized mitochondrial protein AtMg00310-like [Beta vulgaris subsp. vulgaris]
MVAQAIPTYSMQCFAIPVGILKEMEWVCRAFYWGQRGNEKKVAWIPWEKLFVFKKEGGLGIRNLQSFNVALLAKQAWRVMTNTSSLMTKTLKNKYFPNTTFLEAKASPVASYTWRSILSSRKLVEKNAIKVVGGGLLISVWRDPWIRGLPHFKPLPRRGCTEELPQKVSDLMNNGQWDVSTLQEVFSTWERREIQRIPVSVFGGEDTWAWVGTKDEVFSVKSAYYAHLKGKNDDHATSSDNQALSIWGKVWKAKVAPKVLNFG